MIGRINAQTAEVGGPEPRPAVELPILPDIARRKPRIILRLGVNCGQGVLKAPGPLRWPREEHLGSREAWYSVGFLSAMSPKFARSPFDIRRPSGGRSSGRSGGRVATNPAFLMAENPLPAPPLRDKYEFLRNFKFVEANAKGRRLHDRGNPVLRTFNDFDSRLLACFIG